LLSLSLLRLADGAKRKNTGGRRERDARKLAFPDGNEHFTNFIMDISPVARREIFSSFSWRGFACEPENRS
jgi:hypothetical protein